MTKAESKQLSCSFAYWLNTSCELRTSGWLHKYGGIKYYTIEEMYDFWLKNIK